MRENKEIGFLLSVLRGIPHEQDVSAGSLNVDALIRLAMLHRVVYQLMRYAHLHPDAFTRAQITLLDNHCRQAARRSLSQLQELKRIAIALQEQKIGFAVIKGPQLSRMLYGREALKESVDLDIMLVRQQDFIRAHDLLRRLGYSRSNLDGHVTGFSRRLFLLAKREVQYWIPGVRNHIDLHVRPGANAYLTAGRFRGFFDDLEVDELDGSALPVLPPEKYLAYLCYHGALHQFSRLVWLLDIRTFIKLKGEHLDYPKLLAIARRMGCERAVCLTLGLLQAYFGDPVPEPLHKAVGTSLRMKWLVGRCRFVMGRDEPYGASWRGRSGKLIYMMVLIRGMSGRIDLFYGILLRWLAGRWKR